MHYFPDKVYGTVFDSAGSRIDTLSSSKLSHEVAPAVLEQEFRRLVTTWKAQSLPMSSITEMAMLPAYQRIIGLGGPAVPLILRELEREPDYWFWALKAMTGADPVPPESRGRLNEMTETWLQWGHENGYL